MRIIIEVITPGNGKTYELTLDDKLTVGAAKEKITEEIRSFENGCIGFDEGAALFAPVSRSRLPDNRNLRKAGVRSGHKLFLL
ncbi:MAG: ubiquitin family protein [Oscillospiraceae bacterium]|nr:ubiquitin family protein [Oscillospiraceae bacterium]